MPSFAALSTAVVQQNDDIFCFCRKPDDGNYMIGCDGCGEWFHGACVGIDEENEPDVYLCSGCENSGNVDNAGHHHHHHHHHDDEGEGEEHHHHHHHDDDEDDDEYDDDREEEDDENDEDEDDDDEERYDAEAAELEEVRGLLGADLDEEYLDTESGSESEASAEPPRKRARGRRAETPVLRQAQKKRKPAKRIPFYLDPTKYKNLDLGADGPPQWWVDQGLANDQPTYDRGREQLIQCFQVRIDQAKAFDPANYRPSDCPFTREILRMLQDPTWTADKLADICLGGMCRYRQWLMGLNRPPTAEEIRGIPRATSEQLATFGVYTDLITNEGREYRYTGSGTSQLGVGSRWRNGYENPVGSIRSGKKLAPPFRESHVSVLLQRTAKASIRLRASWDRQTISPTLVVMMEAALIDFEDTMGDAVPDGMPVTGRSESSAYWARTHSRVFRDMSRAAYPSGRARSSATGLNRCSPYKQGSHTGMIAHRLRVFEALGGRCPCCDKKRGIGSLKSGRLSTEASFPLPDVPVICVQCCNMWRPTSDKSVDAARKFSEARKKASNDLTRPKTEHCFACKRTYKGTRTFCLPSHPDAGVCNGCAKDWRRHGHEQSEDVWLAARSALEAKERGTKKAAIKAEKCFACHRPDKQGFQAILPSHPDEGLCHACQVDWKARGLSLGETAWLATRAALENKVRIKKNFAKGGVKAPKDRSGVCCACRQQKANVRESNLFTSRPGAFVCRACTQSWAAVGALLGESRWFETRAAGTTRKTVDALRAPDPSGQCWACKNHADKRAPTDRFASNPGAMICEPCRKSYCRCVGTGLLDVDSFLMHRAAGTIAEALKAAKAAGQQLQPPSWSGKGKRKAN